MRQVNSGYLKFSFNLKSPSYTDCDIKKLEGKDLEVRMTNSDGNVITDGPRASAKVKLLALPGDFARDGNPGAEELDEKEVKTRDGQVSVLKGILVRRLVNGTCTFSNIQFREGTAGNRPRTAFILAARVVDRNEDIGGHRVQEAFMDPVDVQTYRSKSNAKTNHPKLEDHVYRLKKISKKGICHQKLQARNIKNVEDFLKDYNKNPKDLSDFLGINQESESWKTMIEHAKECDLRDQHQLKAYKVVGHQIHAVIFFNCVHDIVGAKFNGNYIAKENFNRQQKAIVDGHKKEAYEQIEGIDFHYIMNENGIPSKIPAGNNTNVSGDMPLPTQDIVPPPNPYNHNAPYEDPTHLDYMITMRCPCHEICNTAALIPEGDGSIPLIGDSRNGLSVSDYDVSGDLQTQDTVRLPNTSDHSAPYQAESFIRGLTHVARTPPLHESRNTASRILRAQMFLGTCQC
ncbi:calmodulin-binding protein 60 A-like isoform X2 [Oryza brachyantha]|uniref:calmodulin-binding protein 60 A-like isoform X2 n=1 Tax=Oryza brachyantha TaxID=4533 RepID=UPI0003EAB5D6|nr:calmodulin-binding protein 60 A-like isoform X2 [Oryza brachyantha]